MSKDYGAVTVLADTSATEMDAANAKGWYLFDLAQAETNADALVFSGKSATANISVVGQLVFTTPNRFTTLVIDAAGLADANAVKLGPTGAGTAQTARDVGASVLLSSGVGAGQVSLSAGKIAGVVLVDTVTTYTGNTPQTGDVYPLADTEIAAIKAKTDNLPALPANEATLTTIAGYIDTEVAAIKAKTDQFVFTVANQVDANALSGGGGLNAAGVRAAVGLASANLDTQLTAIDDFLDTEVAAIKAKTDLIPASPAAVGSAMTLATDAISAGTITSDAIAEITAGIAGLNVTELASIPAASPTLIQAIALQYMALRNKLEITSTTKKIHNDAGSALATKTLTDNGLTYAETKMT